MNKYDKLIKELRSCKDKAVFSDYWWDITWRAASAIEELTDSLERYRAALTNEQKVNAERAEFYRDLSIARTQEIQAACTVRATIPEAKPQTNADRIRAMTDEELAEWFSIYCCRNKTYDAHCETFGNCEACWLDWLRQEADNVQE